MQAQKNTMTNSEIVKKFNTVKLITTDDAINISSKEALSMAQDEDLDLVLVSQNKDVVIVKIMDYNKFQYDKKKKQKKSMVGATKNKEVRFGLSTDETDLGIKAKKINEWLEKKYRIKITIKLRGREYVYKDKVIDKMDLLLSKLNTHEIDGKPSMSGRQYIVNIK